MRLTKISEEKIDEIIKIYHDRIFESLDEFSEKNISAKIPVFYRGKFFGNKKILEFLREKQNLCRLTFEEKGYSFDEKLKVFLNADFFNPFFWAICNEKIHEIGEEINLNHTILDYNFKTYFDRKSYDSYDSIENHKLEKLGNKISTAITERILRIVCR